METRINEMLQLLSNHNFDWQAFGENDIRIVIPLERLELFQKITSQFFNKVSDDEERVNPTECAALRSAGWIHGAFQQDTPQGYTLLYPGALLAELLQQSVFNKRKWLAQNEFAFLLPAMVDEVLRKEGFVTDDQDTYYIPGN